MKHLKYLIVGIVFGIVLTKSEAISWYRIYEMFQFQSFHMFGIISTAITTGLIGIYLIKKYKIQDIEGKQITIAEKEKGTFRYWLGGLLFGLGWAMVGACPAPIFIALGAGYLPMIVVLLGALLGTFLYGLFKDKMPH